MIDRRHFLLASLATGLLPRAVLAGAQAGVRLSWADYQDEMKTLASAYADKAITQSDMAARGVQLLQQLDSADNEFQAAVHASYESGNRIWLWQRLIREEGILGGILNITSQQNVPLHDHPGATGILRVLTGNVEVWQFDLYIEDALPPGPEYVVLRRVSHRLLRPGDAAVLLPDSGNIHALRATTPQCSMLDYFIPPYKRHRRSWYLQTQQEWTDTTEITCRRVSEQDYHIS